VLITKVLLLIISVMSTPRYTPEELALLMDQDGNGNEGRERGQSTSTTTSSDEPTMPRAYYNVRAARSATATIRTLGGCVVNYNSSCGSFLVQNDNRVFAANHRHCYGKKANISASFNLETFVCNTCNCRGEHQVLHREVDGTDALDESPVCFVLSDQCFPPLLPVEGDGECIKIFRIEDGTLSELVDAFLGLIRGFSVPAGSVVVLASASYLALVGTAAYAREFVDVGGRLMSTMGGGIEMVHGFPVLLSGTDDSALIRSLADIQHWLGHISTGRDIIRSRATFFASTFGKDIKTFSAGGGIGQHDAPVPGSAGLPEAPASIGSPEAPLHHPMQYVLPVSKLGTDTGIFKSSGFRNLPISILPCSMENERAMISALVDEVNSIFMTNLATEFSVARSISDDNNTAEDGITGIKFVLVGASHASRLANALREAGAEVADLSEPGWRLNAENVESMCILLKEVLEEPWEGETVVIYQLFDNLTYVGIGSDGTERAPTKGTDGRYHVIGSLGLIDRDKFKQLFSTAVPLLRAGGQNRKVLLSPLCRYALESCCDDSTHCVNRGSGLTQMLADGLGKIETWTDDQAYLKRIRNFLVYNPNDFLSPDEDSVTKKDTKFYKMCWNAGPVHMSTFGYEKLAIAIIEAIADGNFSRTQSKTPTEPRGGSATSTSVQRPQARGGQRKVDWSLHRQSWVSGSDTVAHRNYNAGMSRGNRGGGKWRGRGGFFRGRGGRGRGRPY
jgi:hypothetical protein